MYPSNTSTRNVYQSNLYHLSNTIGVLIAITVIVFAAISYQNVQNLNYLLDTCTWSDSSLGGITRFYCFTPNERMVFLSILIGASGLIIILYLFSGVYGCVGASLMKKKRQDEFREYAEAHDNAAFRF
ncbi:hypothetical protein B9Z55_013373 [Caenorhabditis nigoni]|uniref:Uncharacterized protein n=1 Tax=Caenorhabditis nigoni TaxID=1611254 RepID=A0A2G5U1H7_9PELO|nr:hypothetical protein B9Z55_013373 [Caenorhabditis nigoni]